METQWELTVYCKSEEERQSLVIFKLNCCLLGGLTKGLSVLQFSHVDGDLNGFPSIIRRMWIQLFCSVLGIPNKCFPNC